MKLLPLYPGARPCVRCGFCCRRGPCCFGKAAFADGSGCVYLRGPYPGQYECGIIERIMMAPDWDLIPAFGAGCCSPLNADRRRLVEEERSKTA